MATTETATINLKQWIMQTLQSRTMVLFIVYIALFLDYMLLTALVFALGQSYIVLVIARSVQGAGCSCTTVSGMAMLAKVYPVDAERGAAMGCALGAIGLATTIGPAYGGLMYQLFGKTCPFIILACVALGAGILQFFALQPHVEETVVAKDETRTVGSMTDLLLDPYIMIAAGARLITHLVTAMLEPTLPLRMIEIMNANTFTAGLAFLGTSAMYLIGTNVSGRFFNENRKRWLASMMAFVIEGIVIPFAKKVYWVMIPMSGYGLAAGVVDGCITPLMGYLVDIRHGGVYGNVYAVAFAFSCLGFSLGPFCAGPIVSYVGFPIMLYAVAVIDFMYAPLMLFLKNPPARNLDEKVTAELNQARIKVTSDK